MTSTTSSIYTEVDFRNDRNFCDQVKKAMNYAKNIEYVYNTVNYVYIVYVKGRRGYVSARDFEIMKDVFGYEVNDITFPTRTICFKRIKEIPLPQKQN